MIPYIDRTMEQQVQDLIGLIRIPSVSRGEPKDGMPLGEQVNNALEYTLALARRLGFEQARSLDGYCGVVDYGQGDEMLMVMSHLDVVPAGSGWSCEPFSGEIRDGRILGRGAIDDKGPAVSSLYALAAVKQAGIPLKRRVRLLFGCDEERGWSCINRYKQTEPDPTLAFTPDGSYPLVNSEMGIFHGEFHRPLSGTQLTIQCGSAANVIPGEARAHLSFAPIPCDVPEGFTVRFEGSDVSVTGLGGHAAHPDGAKNALCALLQILSQQPLGGDDLAIVSTLAAAFGLDLHGEGFGLDVTDPSGRLTLQLTMMSWNAQDGVTVTMDSRFPFSLTKEQVRAKLGAVLSAAGFASSHENVSGSHYIDPDSELVQALLEVYAQNTGRPAKPLSIGGGTYARAFHNAVAFGAEPENGQEVCHMPDESIGIDEIRFNTVVMAQAIARLAGE